MATLSSKDRALFLLARRDHSRQELSTKLKRHHLDPSEVQDALEYVESLGLIDESSFCEKYIFYRSSRGIGPLKIRQELKMKGVSDFIISEAFKNQPIEWLEILRMLHLKKFHGEIPCDIASRAKQMRFFLSRGFTAEMVGEGIRDPHKV